MPFNLPRNLNTARNPKQPLYVEYVDDTGNPIGLPQDLGTFMTIAAATTTQNSPDQTNVSSRGLKVALTTTTIGTGSLTLHIQGKDSVSATYYDILVGAAVITNTTNIYTVYPGITATTNVSASDILPAIWRVSVVANNANAATYKVGVVLLN